MKRSINNLSAVLLMLPLAAACHAKVAADSEHVAAVVDATVATVGTERFTETVDAVGAVVPRQGHVASLAAPAPTRVAKVFVAAGARVNAGDPLVELDQSSFDAATKTADAALIAAQRSAERATRLADAGVLPKKDAETAAADLAQAQGNAVNARRARELSTLRSPIVGVVTRMSAVMGASVDPSQVLVEVADPAALDVVLTASPADASRVRVGQAVALQAGAEGAGAPVARGTVADVSASVDTSSRGVAVRVEVAPPSSALRIGQTVFGRVGVGDHGSAVVIPIAALVPTGEGFKVFVVDDRSIAMSRPVTIGGRSDRGAWVKDGLKAGERIVTTGAYGVDDSTKIGKPEKEDAKDAKGAKAEEKDADAKDAKAEDKKGAKAADKKDAKAADKKDAKEAKKS